MAVRLRPHHLLCMLTFVGEGYSQAFTDNFQAVLQKIVAGKELIQIVTGPDDICAPLHASSTAHCLNRGIETRDRHAAQALSVTLSTPIESGAILSLQPSTLDLLRSAFASGAIRSACTDCQWKPLCDRIAANNFSGTCLLEGAPCAPNPLRPEHLKAPTSSHHEG